MLRRQLRHVEFLEQEIQELNVEIEERMRPFDAGIELIDGIWGLGRQSAEAILSETGIDMSRWPTDRHITSWAKICPGNNESAGKRRSGWTGKGNPWLRTSLVEAAWGVSRNPNSYFGALYRRLSWSRSTTCSKMEPSTRISALSISTTAAPTARLSFALASAAWRGSATRSPLNG